MNFEIPTKDKIQINDKKTLTKDWKKIIFLARQQAEATTANIFSFQTNKQTNFLRLLTVVSILFSF
jgi:hypothetical protein